MTYWSHHWAYPAEDGIRRTIVLPSAKKLRLPIADIISKAAKLTSSDISNLLATETGPAEVHTVSN
jgi:hypothetical protein